MNALERLKTMTTVVADTGDFNAMKAYAPRDATTNPTLILKAAQMPAYAGIVDEALAWGRTQAGGTAAVAAAVADRLAVSFGAELTAIVPGRVSTEVDADLSFDTAATVAKARAIIAAYAARGIGRERILIKIAATWEGIRAAEILQREGVDCNLTLLFSLVQAAACAEAGAFLISPFVGRIHDWYRKRDGVDYTGETDPGVASVRRIYTHFKRFGFATEVMGASFRNVGQILALAGCDLLTISPELLEQLRALETTVEPRLDVASARKAVLEPVSFDEPRFRFELNEDAMASDKLSEGIRAFVTDARKLDGLVEQARGG